MRIFDGQTELFIPKWITVSSSSMSVKTQTGKVNALHGERLAGDDYYSVRLLKCSGTLITDDYPLVERERSRLHDMLSGRLLRVYRADTDDIFYECILDGQVSSTYYNGRNISKAFTMSFNLKTLQPFGYSSRMIKANRIYRKKKIVLHGNGIGYLEKLAFCDFSILRRVVTRWTIASYNIAFSKLPLKIEVFRGSLYLFASVISFVVLFCFSI
ncbi:MAG: hypothetical protein ACTTH8_08750 [Treponema sp.]